MEKNKIRKTASGVGFYAALLSCAAIVGVCAYSLLAPAETPEREVLPVTPQSVVESAAETAAGATVEKAKPAAKKSEAKKMPEVAVSSAPIELVSPRTVVSPLDGEVVSAFAMDHLIYNEAMGDWRAHDGVDFAAEEGTAVVAACAGTVESVTNDLLTGTRVVLDHGDGYRTIYANLQPQSELTAGQSVAPGEVIGAVGVSAAAEAGAPHLHFSVTKDGAFVDPEVFLKG